MFSFAFCAILIVNTFKEIPMQNLYSASEAMTRLGFTQGQFQNLVRQGKLKRVIPPGRTRGMYSKKEVDELALAMQIFTTQFGSVEIRQTTPADLEEEWDIAAELFGRTTTPVENRLIWLKASPDIMLDIFADGQMMGYLKMAPLKRDTIWAIMRHEKVGADMTPSDFDKYTTKYPIDIFIFGIGVRRSLSRADSAAYASSLMSHAITLLAEKGAQGVAIHGLYTTSYTPYGISICERSGFRTLEWSTSKLRSFELIVAESDSLLVKPYKKAYEEWQRQSGQSQPK
jgi:hypothetical protein